MRIRDNPNLPTPPTGAGYESRLNQQLVSLLQDIAKQLNLLTEGRVHAVTNAASAVPTAGTYAIGDFVRNSAPSELGSASSKYCLFGWLCVDDDPLTFKECRFLTGN